MRVVSAQLLVA